MRIAVVGAGGTGGYFGGLLARAGQDVTFIARGANLEALRTRGLSVQSRLAGTFNMPVQATDDPRELDPVDLILFCVKTYDTDAAAESARPLFHPETLLLSLQNGIDNEERIARATGHSSGLGAAAYVVSAIKALGVVEQTAGPGKIVLGELSGGRARARTGCATRCKKPGSRRTSTPTSGSFSGRSSSSFAPSAASQPSPGYLSGPSWPILRPVSFSGKPRRRWRQSRALAASTWPTIALSKPSPPRRASSHGGAARSTATSPGDGAWSWSA